MPGSENIFCASNPANICEALWSLLRGRDFSGDTIFLPSRRAVRAFEKFMAEKSEAAALLLPRLVALGEGAEDEESDSPDTAECVATDQERILVLAKLLSAAEGKGLASVLPVARDLVRMQNYIENEAQGAKRAAQDWTELVGEKYAEHFQKKAEFLTLADRVLPSVFPGKITEAAKRNAGVRAWIDALGSESAPGALVIVCGSTASVPATADLMEFIAGLDNGRIILPGKIPPRPADDIPETHPYCSEYKFLRRAGIAPEEVRVIKVGESTADFLGAAFSGEIFKTALFPENPARLPTRIDCARESEEAEVAAEIAARATAEGKSVLVITPDVAGNQRLRESLSRRGLVADFSGGISGAMTPLGREILSRLDEELESAGRGPEISDLFGFVDKLIEIPASGDDAEPAPISESVLPVAEKLREVSDILAKHGIELDLADARAVLADALSSAPVRPAMNGDAKIRVLGTMESRMQSADVVVLTGLNEGMFPAEGYENPWLPRRAAAQIGLPPPERKVSLMALDFINLSCGPEVYWLRSEASGGSQTTESRFLSRVSVLEKKLEERRTNTNHEHEPQARFLESARARDDAPYAPLDYSPPAPPADRSPVYVTELELLIHNPYAFYARHILRLKPKDDYWTEPGAKEFGTLVHGVIERQALIGGRAADLIKELDREARKILPLGSALLHFWRKRFVEIAPAVERMLSDSAGGKSEIKLETRIAGRVVRAIADRVWDGFVLDIKTGAAPNKSRLEQGSMPQLPLEAFMLGGADMKFLQLQSNNVKLIEYSGEPARKIIEAAVQKISELFGRYSKDAEPYEYYETGDAKYRAYDDLARKGD